MRFEGATYPPPNFNQLLSTALFWLRMAMLLLLIAGPGVLETLGINNPPWIYTWAQENKVWRKNLHVRRLLYSTNGSFDV